MNKHALDLCFFGATLEALFSFVLIVLILGD